MRWKKNREMPKSSEQIRSPYETEVRQGKKRKHRWNGYKVHITESCSEGKPRLVTNVETTMATVNDSEVVERIHENLKERGIHPLKHIVDRGYISAELLVKSKSDYNIDLLGPAKKETGWQTKIEGGITQSMFTFDWEQNQVICPKGARAKLNKITNCNGKTRNQAEFRKSVCARCEFQERCKKSEVKGRVLQVLPKEELEVLKKRREEQETRRFQDEFSIRAGVEGVHHVLCNTMKMRKSRYRGIKKVTLQHHLTAAALNVKRAVCSKQGISLATRSQPRFMEALV